MFAESHTKPRPVLQKLKWPSRILVILAVSVLGPLAAWAQQEPSRLVYDTAKRAMIGPEARTVADVDRRLSFAGLTRNPGGAWVFSDKDGQVLVTAEFGLHVYIVGYSPSVEAPLSGEVLAALGRGAKTVSFSGPDEIRYVFDVFGDRVLSRSKMQVREEVVVRIGDGRWNDTQTIIQFEQ